LEWGGSKRDRQKRKKKSKVTGCETSKTPHTLMPQNCSKFENNAVNSSSPPTRLILDFS